jgi:hypothetical protein
VKVAAEWKLTSADVALAAPAPGTARARGTRATSVPNAASVLPLLGTIEPGPLIHLMNIPLDAS